ncbi:osiris 22 [Aphomia sociella]
MACATCFLYFCIVLSVKTASATTQDLSTLPQNDLVKKIELIDGVSLKVPHNDTEKLFSFEINTKRTAGEGRGKQKKLMERILPLFIMPFVIQSTIVPLFLSMLKFMLFKALMVGKLAMGLIILNAFKNHSTVKGRDAEMAEVHYGYHGSNMEYGAYMPS